MKKNVVLVFFGLLFACSSTQYRLTDDEKTLIDQHASEVEQNIAKKLDHFPDARPWESTDFSNQVALGYDANTFSVPEPLRKRVDFWIDIFSKYTSSQGVLHDSRYVDIIYGVVDFTEIDNNNNLSSKEKAREEKKILEARRKEIIETLKKLNQVTDASNLSEDEKIIWNKFENIEEENKFLNATLKGRLRFQFGLKDRMHEGIYQSGRYIREMEKIFQSYGLPIELTRLPFVESSFNLKARSKVGASGIWQFMRGTGKRFMKVNPQVDERNDPIIATHAAAKLLKYNYEHLKSWPLAVTAYNYGTYGMKRIVEKTGTTELFDLYGKRHTSRFGFATESFYASYLAALEVERNAKKYFGSKAVWAPEFKYDEVKITKNISFNNLKSFFAEDSDLAKFYNPHLSRLITQGSVKIPSGTRIKLPSHQKTAFEDFLNKAEVRSVSTSIDGTIPYTVARGDTLYDISIQFQTTIDRILQVNQDLDPMALRPGQVIAIPQ